jgi:hypothetical protein
MGNLRLYGSSSGYVEIAPPAVGGSQVLTLPTDSVQPGMVLVNKTDFSSVSSVSLNNVFTSAYANYRVSLTFTAITTGPAVFMRLRSGGSDNGSSYNTQTIEWYGTAVAAAQNANGDGTKWTLIQNLGTSNPQTTAVVLDVLNPALALQTVSLMQGLMKTNSGVWVAMAASAVHDATSSFDGMTAIFAGSTSGTVRIYGLRNS